MRQRLYVLALTAALSMVGGGGRAFAQAGGPGAWSASDCAICHDKAVNANFQHSAHGKSDQSCATCHKDVSGHMQRQLAGEKGPTPTLKTLKVRDGQRQVLPVSCGEARAIPLGARAGP